MSDWISRATLVALLGTALLPRPATADLPSMVSVWLEEDAYCGGPKSSVKTPTVVLRRYSPLYPEKALQRGLDGSANVRLMIDSNGQVTDAVVLSEAPDAGFGRAVASAGKTGWRFAPGNSGSYCLNVTFEIQRGSEPPRAPWDDSTLPIAPNPISTQPAPYLPVELQKAGGKCHVELNIRIDQNGAVPTAAMISENPTGYQCGMAAREAVEGWLFPPGTTPGHYRLVLNVQ